MSRIFLTSFRSSPSRRGRKKHRLGFESLEDRALLANEPILVTNIEEFGAAINKANFDEGFDIIKFAIPGTGPHVYHSVLPTILQPLEIDGWSQAPANYSGPPLIVVDPNGAGPEISPNKLWPVLSIQTDHTTVRGLVITDTRRTETGDYAGAYTLVAIGQRAQNPNEGTNTIAGCFIGTNYDGTDDIDGRAETLSTGIGIVNSPKNIIGGTTPRERNVIAGNRTNIDIFSAPLSFPPDSPQARDPSTIPSSRDNQILGNYIGTDRSGNRPLTNVIGISIVGPATNGNGSKNNFIGGARPRAGEVSDGNSLGAGNVIAGHSVGIVIGDDFDLSGPNAPWGASLNHIEGNNIGIGADGRVYNDEGNSLDNTIGVRLTGSEAKLNTIGGLRPELGNVISGNVIGVEIVKKAEGNLIRGNLIGTDPEGTVERNNGTGVLIASGARDNLIGGTQAGSRNVISGNDTGVRIQEHGTTGNKVLGNYIGTDKEGTARLIGDESNRNGVVIENANDNDIGGTAVTVRNVISGNSQNGVVIFGAEARGNKVLGNYIGTDKEGDARLAGDKSNHTGVLISGGARDNFIGGTEQGSRNIISGNMNTGVALQNEGTTGNKVLGNYIGTDNDGTEDLGNKLGVAILGQAKANFIGGTEEGSLNVISGNTVGVQIQSAGTSGNNVLGNYIGTDAGGTRRVSNQHGIAILGANENIIADGNVISGNLRGISLVADTVSGSIVRPDKNQIKGNLIGTDKNGAFNDSLDHITLRDLGNNIGIELIGATGTIIGGSRFSERNLIDNNRVAGIRLEGASRTQVLGNEIAFNNPNPVRSYPDGGGVLVSDSLQTTLGGTTVIPGTGLGNWIHHNSHAGVWIQDSRADSNVLENSLLGNRIEANDGDGVKIQTSAHVTISDGNSIVLNNGTGISIQGSERVKIVGNSISKNEEHGVRIVDGNDVTISGSNRIHENRHHGVELLGGSTLVISGNSIHENSGHGIAVRPSDFLAQHLTFDNNTIKQNGQHGINVVDGRELLLHNNSVEDNGEIGVNIEGSRPVTLTGGSIIAPGRIALRCRNSVLGWNVDHFEGELDCHDSTPPAPPEQPQVQRATSASQGNSTIIEGVIRAAPNTDYFTVFYESAPIDPANLQLLTRLGSTTITTDENGVAYFRTIVEPTVPLGHSVVFSVTGPDGHTSDLSLPAPVTDRPPVDEISVDDMAFAEGDAGTGAIELTLTRRNFSDQTVTVEVSTNDGTATVADGDYAPLSGFLVTFSTGVIEQKVRVDLLGDQAPEPNETFSVTIGNPGGDAVIGRATATATILNDDENTISIGDATILEGVFGETPLLQLPVSLLNPTSQPITVEVNTADGTATTADFDYLPIQGLVLTFVPGGSLTQFVTIQVPGDDKVEADEMLTVTLSNPTGSRVGLGRSTANATITNDDATAISIDSETLPEGHGVTRDFVFVVSLTNPSDTPVSVRLDTADGTATAAGGDYHPASGMFLTFNPGEVRKLVTVRATGDSRVEPDEWFEVNLSNAVGANVSIAGTTAVGTILNDDTTAFSVSDATVTEGDGVASLTFTVSLSQPSDAPLSVRADTANGSAALADGDYAPIENLVLVFEPGAPLSQVVTVNVLGDVRPELDETVRLILSTATGANVSIADATGVGTIRDDDPDNDGDGVSDKIEDLGPGGGDGNGDGLPDRDQANVASIPALTDEYVTLVSSPGTSLVNVAAVQNPDPLRSPGGIDFLVGFFQYDLVGAGVDGATTLTLGRPSTADIVYQFGALTPFDPIASFYEFAFDGATGAEIASDSVVLHLMDGARGDRDLSPDGVIRGLTGLGRVLGADVSVQIADAPDPVGEGQMLTYTLTARNEGPHAANDVILIATLPEGASFTSATSDQGAFTQSDGVVTFHLGSLAPDSAAMATVVARAPGPGHVTATAMIEAGQSDHRPANNTAHIETFVKDIVSISGQKFEDSNGNGLRDPGELGLNGFSIELVDPATGGVLTTTITAPIDVNGDRTLDPETEYGRYAFDFLVTGTYEVRERVVAGFAQTFPSGGAASTERVSVTTAGAEANRASTRASISADGRFVAFESTASNLVPGDTNGLADIFIYDRQTGIIEIMSLPDPATGHAQADRDCTHPTISPDGRFVAFASRATNLVPGDTNRTSDIFLRDRVTGTIERVSVNATGQQGDGSSGPTDGGWGPSISEGGRYVAFESTARNLPSELVTDGMHVFVKDRLTGMVEYISRPAAGITFSLSHSATISADGRFVSFQAESALSSDDTNNSTDVFVFDRQAGSLTRLSVDSAGNQANGGSRNARISADGRFVAFDSAANNLVPGDTNNLLDVFVKDLLTGAVERVNVDASGNQASGGFGSQRAFLSGDGRYVGFDSDASNLVPLDTNNSTDVFVFDRETRTIERVSVSSGGDQAAGGAFFTFSGRGALNRDGRFIAFESNATNLVPGDLNSFQDVFVRDRGGSDSYRVTVVPGEEAAGRDFGNRPQHATDSGDAPDTYGTLLASDGARHFSRGPFLGFSRDAESDAEPTADASGDNSLGLADEDGVTFTSELVRGDLATIIVTASASGLLDAWIDFDRNGVFDAVTEQIAHGDPLAAGDNLLLISVSLATQAGPSFARFRISTAGGVGPTGGAPDGEVEDYPIDLVVRNLPPISLADAYTTNEDAPLVVAAAGILSNDVDLDGDMLDALLIAEPRHGVLVLNSDGSFTYTPNANFHGRDRFAYKSNDGGADAIPATVSITVLPLNDPLLARDDAVATGEDTSVVIDVTANDADLDGAIDPASVAVTAQPIHGSVLVHPTTGVVTYTPRANFHGADSFTYTVRDDSGAISNLATVTIVVEGINDAPVAQPDSFTVNQGETLTVAGPGVLANDSDMDSDVVSARLVSGPTNGALTVNASGGFNYTPLPGFSGLDSFTYEALDASSTSAPVAVTINVLAVSSSISGRVFTDVTGNGLSADDTPLGQVTVKLYRDANLNKTLDIGTDMFVTAMHSAEDTGAYTFGNLAPATYFVTEVVPGDFVQTAPLSRHYTIDLAAGQTAINNDFANFRKCPPNSVTQISYLINGTARVTDLRGKTNQGDLVTVQFTVIAGPAELTLVAYTAPGPTFVAAAAHLQRIFDVDSGVFPAGKHEVTVQIPNSYYQIDFVCGKPIDKFGPAGSNIFYSPQMRLLSADNDGHSPVLANPASIAGSVYVDGNGDGARNPNEEGIGLVKVKLSGTSHLGRAVTLVRLTQPDGSYKFDNLAPGNYSITEFQPGGFRDGADRAGNIGGTVGDDVIGAISLGAGVIGVDYDFGERRVDYGTCSLSPSWNAVDATLHIDGTPASDTISVTQYSDSRYAVTINGCLVGIFASTGVTRLAINGYAGNDRITLASNIVIPAEIHGGDGNDYIQGGSGSNIITGGAGNDTLKGGSLRDILFGGTGSDTVFGNGGDDLVVAGATAFDARSSALWAILAEWTSSRDYSARVKNIVNGTGSATPFNGDTFLNDDTVFDDGVIDYLTGNSGRDWFLGNSNAAGRDKVHGRATNEILTNIDV